MNLKKKMSYFKAIIILLALSILLNTCKHIRSGTHMPGKECIELNNKGGEYLMKFPQVSEDLDKATELFKQAIACDSNYLIAYINLANGYGKKHLYNEEMAALNKLIVLTNNDPAILVEKAMLLERKNESDSAKKIYYSAKVNYEERLSKNPGDANLITGIINLKALTQGKEEAIKELDKQIKNHPELSSKLSYQYEIYKYFDRRYLVFGQVTEISTDKKKH